MAWINLQPSATATRASYEHLAAIVGALFAEGSGRQPASRDRLTMGRAVGWVVVLGLVILLGTHPGSLLGLLHHILGLLQGAGNELSAFFNLL